MSVFVDDMLREATVRNGTHLVRGRWSHLMADTSSELLTFAVRLGLKPAWIQKPGTSLEYFDITAGKRARAPARRDRHRVRQRRSPAHRLPPCRHPLRRLPAAPRPHRLPRCSRGARRTR